LQLIKTFLTPQKGISFPHIDESPRGRNWFVFRYLNDSFPLFRRHSPIRAVDGGGKDGVGKVIRSGRGFSTGFPQAAVDGKPIVL
jgi:hypothetical protein